MGYACKLGANNYSKTQTVTQTIQYNKPPFCEYVYTFSNLKRIIGISNMVGNMQAAGLMEMSYSSANSIYFKWYPYTSAINVNLSITCVGM